MTKMNKKGEDLSSSTYESLYRASQESEVSLGALRNARDKMNDFVIRRDKVPFKLLWQNIHKDCFVARKENEKLAERERELERERKEKEKLKKMNVEELADYRKKKQEEENKRDLEAKKKFDRFFGSK